MATRVTNSGCALRKFSILAIFLLGLTGIYIVYSYHLNGPPIRSDGVGYYLYLPATFIYHDICLRHTAAEHFNGQIPGWTGAVLYKDTGNYLIKYPMGEALLIFPFFLAAYFISLITHANFDGGFSFIFQYAAAISGLFYVTAGLANLLKMLQRYFKPQTILFGLFGLLFGTNLFHYATYDSIFSHAYSLFLFCTFIYLISEAVYKERSLLRLIGIGTVAGLIVVTRPPNGLWLLFGLFFGVTSIEALFERLQFWRRNIKECAIVLIPLFGITALQCTYWKIITGHFLVYTYSGESFDFMNPHILGVLFSIRKGLFVWSPILLTVFPGLYYVRKKAPEFFVPILIFLPLNIYVISCWWCWWYGGGFGHRAFVESIPLFAVCLCSFYEGIDSILGKRILIFVTLFCVAIEIWLMAKYWTGAIPFDGVTLDHLKALLPGIQDLKS